MSTFKQKIVGGVEKVKLGTEKLKSAIHPLQTFGLGNRNQLIGTWYILAEMNQISNQPLYNPRLTIQQSVPKTFTSTKTQKTWTSYYTVQQSGQLGSYTGQQVSHSGELMSLEDSISQLKIKFENGFKSDFYVLDSDVSTSYLVIGSRNRNNAWILSRQPSMDKQLLDSLIRKLENLKFDISKIMLTFQQSQAIPSQYGSQVMTGTSSMSQQPVTTSGSFSNQVSTGTTITQQQPVTTGSYTTTVYTEQPKVIETLQYNTPLVQQQQQQYQQQTYVTERTERTQVTEKPIQDQVYHLRDVQQDEGSVQRFVQEHHYGVQSGITNIDKIVHVEEEKPRIVYEHEHIHQEHPEMHIEHLHYHQEQPVTVKEHVHIHEIRPEVLHEHTHIHEIQPEVFHEHKHILEIQPEIIHKHQHEYNVQPQVFESHEHVEKRLPEHLINVEQGEQRILKPQIVHYEETGLKQQSDLQVEQVIQQMKPIQITEQTNVTKTTDQQSPIIETQKIVNVVQPTTTTTTQNISSTEHVVAPGFTPPQPHGYSYMQETIAQQQTNPMGSMGNMGNMPQVTGSGQVLPGGPMPQATTLPGSGQVFPGSNMPQVSQLSGQGQVLPGGPLDPTLNPKQHHHHHHRKFL